MHPSFYCSQCNGTYFMATSFHLEGSGQCKVFILLCKFEKSFGQECLELSVKCGLLSLASNLKW